MATKPETPKRKECPATSPFRFLKKKKENPEAAADRIAELEAELNQSRVEAAQLREDLAGSEEKHRHVKAKLESARRHVHELEKLNADLTAKLQAMSTKSWKEYCGSGGGCGCGAPTFVERAIGSSNATAPAAGGSEDGDAAGTSSKSKSRSGSVAAEDAPNGGVASAVGRFGAASATPRRRNRAESIDIGRMQSYATLSPFV